MDRNLKRAFLGSLVLVLISITALFLKINDLRAELLMSISGKVIDYDTGKGIPNIAVVIFPYNWAKTDKDGNFLFTEIPEGRYKVDIAKTCASVEEYYVPHQYPEFIEVRVGKNVSGVKIYLRKGGEVSGRVLAEDGVTPIKGALLDVTSSETGFYTKVRESTSRFNAQGQIISKYTFQTDNEGRYKAKGLWDKFEFDIRTKAYGYATEWKELRIKYGEELRNVDFIMGMRGKCIVKGRVLSSKDKTPIANATIDIQKEYETYKEGEYDSGMGITDSNGNFQIKGLTPGCYEVSASPPYSDWDKYDEQKYEPIYGFWIYEGKENYVEIYLTPKEEHGASIASINKIKTEEMLRKFWNIFFPQNQSVLYASIFPLLIGDGNVRENKENCSCITKYEPLTPTEAESIACVNYKKNFQTKDEFTRKCWEKQKDCMIDNCSPFGLPINIDCKKCQDDRCAQALSCGNEITICIEDDGGRSKECRHYYTLKGLILHEMIHLCDCRLPSNMQIDDCQEACAYCQQWQLYKEKEAHENCKDYRDFCNQRLRRSR